MKLDREIERYTIYTQIYKQNKIYPDNVKFSKKNKAESYNKTLFSSLFLNNGMTRYLVEELLLMKNCQPTKVPAGEYFKQRKKLVPKHKAGMYLANYLRKALCLQDTIYWEMFHFLKLISC